VKTAMAKEKEAGDAGSMFENTDGVFDKANKQEEAMKKEWIMPRSGH
jgi:hypothetical protein